MYMNKIYFLLLTWSCYFFDETTSLRSLDNIWVTTKHYSFLDIWDSMSLPCHFLVHFLTCSPSGYFYFWWHCVEQIGSATHFSTNERFLKAVVTIARC